MMILLIWLGLMVVVNMGWWQPGDPWLATALSLATGLLLPGYLISRWAGLERQGTGVGQVAAAFLLGLGILNGLAVLSQLLGLTLAHFTGLATGVTLLLAGPVLWRWFREKEARPDRFLKPVRSVEPVRSKGQWVLTAFTPMLLAGAIWLFVSTASTASFFDNQFYLAFIRHFQQDNLDPHYWPISRAAAAGGATLARASLNGWWIVKAFLNQTSGVDLQVWYAQTFVLCLLLIALSATYSLTYTLSKQRHTATLSVALQLVIALTSLNSHEWLGRGFFDRIIEDKFLVVLVLLPVATGLLWQVWVEGNRRARPLLVLAGSALVFTHPLGMGQWVLLMAGFGMWRGWQAWRGYDPTPRFATRERATTAAPPPR